MKLGLILIAGSALSACNRQSGNEPLVIQPGRDSKATESQFGKGFGAAFNAAPNSEPRNVTENDVLPVSLTAEPVAID